MVIGKGMVAKAFNKYADDAKTIVFASGVSNSTLLDKTSFEREKELVYQTMGKYPDRLLIYFSTCSIYDSTLKKSAYVQHKLQMEHIITQNANYIIFRTSNLAGFSTNPNTVLNYFFQHVRNGLFFQLWKNSSRNIIDVEDAFDICNCIIEEGLFRNTIVNVANPKNSKVLDIVKAIEDLLKKKGNYELIEKTSNPEIDVKMIVPLFHKLNLAFGDDYLKNVIAKYYSI